MSLIFSQLGYLKMPNMHATCHTLISSMCHVGIIMPLFHYVISMSKSTCTIYPPLVGPCGLYAMSSSDKGKVLGMHFSLNSFLNLKRKGNFDYN